MRTTIRLQIQTDDLNCPYLRDPFGQKVDLGADQVGDLERFFPWKYFDSYLTAPQPPLC